MRAGFPGLSWRVVTAGLLVALASCTEVVRNDGPDASQEVVAADPGDVEPGTPTDAATDGSPPADAEDLPVLDAPLELLSDLADVSAGDVPVAKKPAWSDCTANAECEVGFCIWHAGKRVCTDYCLPEGTECPQGWTCSQAPGGGGDTTFICASRFWMLCRPCRDESDCVTDLGEHETCVRYSPLASFCGAGCAQDQDCPLGYQCRSADGVGGGTSLQCVFTAGECTCTSLFIVSGFQTVCLKKNALGTCKGTRKCMVAGLSECTAPEPVQEFCNNLDDDCDGETDEGLVDCCRCGNGACEPACGETLASCPYDCKVCGDGLCSPSEGPDNCAQDCCGACGDGRCMGAQCGENQTTCAQDCGFACGNKTCDKGENPQNCPEDCKWKVCGNGVCEGGEGLEGPTPCPADCGKYCGNCICDAGETFVTCPTDCGYCGDGVCSPCSQMNETVETCWKDCCKPGSEVCDGVDNNCDGQVDEEGAAGCEWRYKDVDGDGYGQPLEHHCLCNPGPPYTATKDGDCDDAAAGVHPGATEVCNGKDDDCNGVTDDGDTGGCSTFYADQDGDGYGTAGDSKCLCAPAIPYTASKPGDCLDSDPTVNPGATEVCNGKDDDCDGSTDPEGTPACLAFYLDADGDGFGDPAQTKCLCAAAGQYTTTKGGDCLDSEPTVNPGATEVCNGRDDNCDGSTDPEGTPGCQPYYLDSDGDGFGDPNQAKCLCGPAAGYLAQAGDCDDSNAAVHPGATDACNGKDDNCDGVTDPEDSPDCQPWYRDVDQDGWGDANAWKCLCAAAGQYSSQKPGDCNDLDDAVHPGAAEACDGRDNDCNGTTDEGFLCGSKLCLNGACWNPLCGGDGLCQVPAGPFWMGRNKDGTQCPSNALDTSPYTYELPCHLVTVPAFKIDHDEVTVARYKACVTAGACSAPSTASYTNWGVSGKEQHPVNGVSWNQAKAYCTWAGERLCSEAEWEKAARGTDGRLFPWGNQPATCDYAVMNETSLGSDTGCKTKSTWPVGSKSAGASPYGPMDMVGNIEVWVEDWWFNDYSTAPTDGSARETPPQYGRVVRGAGFEGQKSQIRASYRWYFAPTSSPYWTGIRCCK